MGLFVAFLISLYIVYATLHRGLRLFKKKLNAKEFDGNDSSGFLTAIYSYKAKFGFKKISVYMTEHNTPPLIWKNRSDEAHVILNSRLLDNLKSAEIRLLALLVLSHLEKRSFFVTPVLSVINQSFFNLNIFSIVLSSLVTYVFNTRNDIFKSDSRFKIMAEATNYELGFFINKLHEFDFNQNKKQIGTEYFSLLSLKKHSFLNQHGIPNLKLRLINIMGFSI